jgi:hypothetical protein
MFKFGSYVEKESGRWQFSLGLTFWPLSYCGCHEWCIIVELGFWYLEIGKLIIEEDL